MFDVEFINKITVKSRSKSFCWNCVKTLVAAKTIRFEKMLTYLRVLEEKGTMAGYPYV